MIKRGFHPLQSVSTITIFLFVILINIVSADTYLFNSQDYNPAGGYHSSDAGVIFSGINNSGIVACPWTSNQSNPSVLIANQEFKDHFNEEISTEIQQYPWITEFSIEYVNTTHVFDNRMQTQPNKTAPSGVEMFFDPYYALIKMNYGGGDNATRRERWDKEIAPVLETSFSEKWYIKRFEFLIIKKDSGGVPGFTFIESMVSFLALITVVSVLKRKNAK